MYSVAFVGPKIESLVLKMLGIETFIASEPNRAMKVLKDLAQKGTCNPIIISESIAWEISDEIEALKTGTLSIIPVPGARGGFDAVRENMHGLSKKAIGKGIVIHE